MDDKLRRLKEILERPFNAGTQVTNCVSHSGRPFSDRPSSCVLCYTDLKNHIWLCHDVNDFLNKVKADALAEIARP